MTTPSPSGGGGGTSLKASSSATSGPISFGASSNTGGNTGLSGTAIAIIAVSVLVVGGLILYLVKKS